MQVAITLFPRNTALDFVGPYDVLQRVPSIDVVFVGHRRGDSRPGTRSNWAQSDSH